MDVRLTCSPSYTMAYCFLEAGESVLAEYGAMAAMSAGISVAAGFGGGGVIKAAIRNQFGGESFIMARYTGDFHGAWVALSPRFPGDVTTYELDDNGLLVQSGSLLAIAETVSVDVKWAGVRSIVLREGATLLRMTGHGTVLLASYGGFQRFDLGDGEQMIVDSGHLVAFGGSIAHEIGPLGGVATSMLTGEGIVAKLTGPGPVFVQTRAETALESWLMPDRQHNKG